MNLKPILALTLAVSTLLGASRAGAADVKTYQVQKGEEKWQVARCKDAKITGDLKVGAKVTIQYRMVATEVEVKK